jgi:hypothetical protein
MAMRAWTISIVIASAVAACGGSTKGGGGSGGSAALGGSGALGGAGAGGVGGGGAAGLGGSSASGGSAATGGGGSGGMGAVYDWEACKSPGDCMLFATNCCGGYCSEEPITGWIPVNIASIGVVQNQYCSEPVGCPDCITFPHENYVGVCRADKCVAIDIRTDEVTSCQLDDECVLRFGSDCCEACNSIIMELVAVRADGKLQQQVCSPLSGACPPCMPPDYPDGAKAQCVAGHCQVVWATQPGG